MLIMVVQNIYVLVITLLSGGFISFSSRTTKIASFLSTIDEIIQSTESELTAWQERKKGVMQKIFSREVRFKADDGSEFPEWEEKEWIMWQNCYVVLKTIGDWTKCKYGPRYVMVHR